MTWAVSLAVTGYQGAGALSKEDMSPLLQGSQADPAGSFPQMAAGDGYGAAPF